MYIDINIWIYSEYEEHIFIIHLCFNESFSRKVQPKYAKYMVEQPNAAGSLYKICIKYQRLGL